MNHDFPADNIMVHINNNNYLKLLHGNKPIMGTGDFSAKIYIGTLVEAKVRTSPHKVTAAIVDYKVNEKQCNLVNVILEIENFFSCRLFRNGNHHANFQLSDALSAFSWLLKKENDL